MASPTTAPGFAWPGPPWRVPRGVYVHIPFCAHHCGYCDFAVIAGRDELADAYLGALEREIATLGRPRPVATIFIGGGTPSHLSTAQLERLMQILRNWFTLVGGAEFTVEANPESLDAAKIDVLADHGVNRLSLGAQSFHPHLLRSLERLHDSRAIPRAVATARRRMPSVSLDLIFAAPGQTLDQWRADLQQAIGLGVDHLSTYGLTYEKGTRLWKERAAGRVMPVADEVERAMYAAAMELLPAAGFEQYEISNFARPAHRSRHNESYWANHAYYGFGLGAARFVDGQRETNTRDPHRYLTELAAGRLPIQLSETLNDQERAGETAMLQLRRVRGIHRPEFIEQTGVDPRTQFARAMERHVARGWLAADGESIRLTQEGRFFADSVCQEFLAEALAG